MIKKNNQTIGTIYKGDTWIGKIYKGTVLVYEAWKKLIKQGLPPLTLNKCKENKLLNYKIYGNQDPEAIILPDEYVRLDYIESTGTQYINTGFKPNPKTTRVETTFQVTDNTKINQRLFGARKSYSDGETICNIFWNSQKMGNAFRVDWVGNASTVSSKFSLNTDITIVSENNKVIINDLEEYTSTTSKSDSYLDFPIYINNFTSNGQLEDNQQPAYAKWKTFKIYDNGTLVRDFVPCYRKNDNEIGLYDIVNKVFYTNSGAGTFSKGDDVEGLSGTMSSQQFTYGIAQKLLANTYTKEGYTFTGWNTKPDGTGISYTDEQEVNNLTADNNGTVTLYAQWN